MTLTSAELPEWKALWGMNAALEFIKNGRHMVTFQSSALGVSCKEVFRETLKGKDRQLKSLEEGLKRSEVFRHNKKRTVAGR